MKSISKISIVFVLSFSTSMAYSQFDCTTYWQRAEKLKAEGNCAEAIKQYENYKECNPLGAEKANAKIAECKVPPDTIEWEPSPPDKILKIYNHYKLEIKGSNVDNDRPNVYNDFKIVTTTAGDLTLSFKTQAVRTTVLLIKDDNSQKPKQNDKIGKSQWRDVLYNDWKSWKRALHLEGTSTDRVYEGSFTYLLDAGTYTLRITRSLTGISPVELQIGFERR